jgi:hypothetical protein
MISNDKILKTELNNCIEKFNDLEKHNTLLIENHEKLESNFNNQNKHLSERNERFENYHKNNENEKNEVILKISEIEKTNNFLLLNNQDLKNILESRDYSLAEFQTRFDEKSVENDETVRILNSEKDAAFIVIRNLRCELEAESEGT